MRLICIALGALTLAGAALAASRSASLEVDGPWVAGRAVEVWCYPNGEWADEAPARTPVGTGPVYMDGRFCDALTSPRWSTRTERVQLAIAGKLFGHELVHALGVTNEGVAECLGWQLAEPVLVRRGVPRAVARAAVSDLHSLEPPAEDGDYAVSLACRTYLEDTL